MLWYTPLTAGLRIWRAICLTSWVKLELTQKMLACILYTLSTVYNRLFLPPEGGGHTASYDFGGPGLFRTVNFPP